MPVDTCIHHWVIASPEGEESEGVCVKCSQTRVFKNYLPQWDFLTQAEQRLGKLEGMYV